MKKGLSDKERSQIVKDLHKKFKVKYGSKLLYFGVKGSMARGTHTAGSDIDSVAIISQGKGAWKEFYYNGILVDISIFTKKQAFDYVQKVDLLWPLRVGSVLATKKSFEKGKIISQLKKEKLKIPHKNFLEACETHELDEYLRKANAEFRKKNYPHLRYCAWEIFFMACMNLALINKTFYTTHGANMVNELGKMKTFLPKNFKKIALMCFNDNPKKVIEGCRALHTEAKSWEKRFKYDKYPKNRIYSDIKDINF